MITRTDYLVAALVGFLAGVFAIPTFVNLGLRDHTVLVVLPLVAPVVLAMGVWVGKLLSRWVPVIAQFAKFAAVGFLNTAIDFGVLNVLSAITGITSGFILGGVNIPGFILAVTNGYFWNKFWVFSANRVSPKALAVAQGGSASGGKDREKGGVLHDFPKFFAVSVIAALLNSGIVVVLTTYTPAQFGIESNVWLNISKAVASAAALLWNFVGYKFFVFVSTKSLKAV